MQQPGQHVRLVI